MSSNDWWRLYIHNLRTLVVLEATYSKICIENTNNNNILHVCRLGGGSYDIIFSGNIWQNNVLGVVISECLEETIFICLNFYWKINRISP